MAIFMIGSECSGATQLRPVLNRLPQVAAPEPADVLQKMTPLMDRYGDLAEQRNFLALVDDVCRLIKLTRGSWKGVPLSRDDIAETAPSRTLPGVLAAAYDQAALVKHAPEWCCSSLSNINYLPQIETLLPGSKYLFIYRDGRDVAVSLRKLEFGEKHFYHIAREWARTQRLALTMEAIIGPERFFRVKYEQLMAQPELVLDQLCRFLGSEFSPGALLSTGTDGAEDTAFVTGADGRVAATPAEKISTYLREASADDAGIFESVAGKVMDALGYPRSAVPIGREHYYREAQVRIFDAENELLKRKSREGMDDRARSGIDSQTEFLSHIAGRRAASTDVLANLDLTF